MAKTHKIMAAVDLSEFSMMTVRYSMWLATTLNAELVLVSVINQRDLDMVRRAMVGYEAFSFPDYLSDQVKDRKARMMTLVEEAGIPSVVCRCLVRDGIPYRELLAAIDEEKPDLIVVSTKGRSNMADAVVGSTARKMYRRSPIPLVSVPAGYTAMP